MIYNDPDYPYHSAHQYTICATLSFGWATIEFLTHIKDDYHLLKEKWRWGHLTYFGARYSGLLATTSFLIMACVGKYPDSTCRSLFTISHILLALLFLSSSSLFWLRAGILSKWNRLIMIPLALYGLVIVSLALRGSVYDYLGPRKNLEDGGSRDIFVCQINIRAWDGVLIKYLMASFDLITAIVTFTFLHRESRSKERTSWLNAVLLYDQLIYISAATFTYVGLGSASLSHSDVMQSLDVLCPSIVSIITCRLFLRLKRKGSRTQFVLSPVQQNFLASPSPMPTPSPSPSPLVRSSMWTRQSIPITIASIHDHHLVLPATPDSTWSGNRITARPTFDHNPPFSSGIEVDRQGYNS